MPKSLAILVDDAETHLNDSANAVWTAVEVQEFVTNATIELSRKDPFQKMEMMNLETRTGQATATTAGALVDATETQFVAADVNKVIFNTTTRTWAIVTAFVSSSQLTLSNDIMLITNDYLIFHQNCWNNRQLYLGDIEDYIGADRGIFQLEFPISRLPAIYRTFVVRRDVLEMGIDYTPPDSDPGEVNQIEVILWYNARHFVSELTDLLGAADGAENALATTMDFKNLNGSEVIREGQEFTIAGIRGRYRVVTEATLAGGATTSNGIEFWPPVESAISDNDVVTLLDSTLSPEQERIVSMLAAGRAAIDKGTLLLQQANDGITQTDLMNVQIDQAIASLDGSREKIDLVNKGIRVVLDTAEQARAELATAEGFGAIAASYRALAETAAAFSRWGQDMVAQALSDNASVKLKPKSWTALSRTR